MASQVIDTLALTTHAETGPDYSEHITARDKETQIGSIGTL
jgi:hypothetical protein